MKGSCYWSDSNKGHTLVATRFGYYGQYSPCGFAVSLFYLHNKLCLIAFEVLFSIYYYEFHLMRLFCGSFLLFLSISVERIFIAVVRRLKLKFFNYCIFELIVHLIYTYHLFIIIGKEKQILSKFQLKILRTCRKIIKQQLELHENNNNSKNIPRTPINRSYKNKQT